MRTPAQPDRLARALLIAALCLAIAPFSGAPRPAEAGLGTWTATNGPLGGNIRALVVDPVTPSTLYAVEGFTGVFKSTNSGASWTVIDAGLPGVGIEYDALAIDPKTPSTLYLGTNGGGVFQSSTGGASWHPINNGLPQTTMLSLAVDPVTPSVLYVGTEGDGAFKSPDGGGTWVPFSNGPPPNDPGLHGHVVYSLAIDPQTPTTLYAGTEVGVYKLVDAFQGWLGFSNGLPASSIVYALAIDPLDSNIRFAGTNHGAYEIEGNVTWQSFNTGLPANTRVFSFAFNPTGAFIGYAGTSTGIFKIVGTLPWQPASAGLGNQPVLHLAIDPGTPSRIYAGAESAGVFKTTTSGASWSAANEGLVPLDLGSVVIDPLTPSTLYASSIDIGVYKSTNGGASWTLIDNGLPPPPLAAFAIDPHVPSTLLVSLDTTVFRSQDGGTTWTRFDAGLPTADPPVVLAADPSVPDIRYAGTLHHGVYRQAGSADWQQLSTGLPVNPGIRALAIDPQVSTTLYASVVGAGIYKTTTSGSTWSPVTAGLPPPATSDANALVVDPQTPSTVYAAESNAGVYKSTNGGASWTPVNTGLTTQEMLAIAVDPRAPATLYAGTLLGGVFKTTNGGASWSSFNSGLDVPTIIRVRDLAVSPNLSSIVYAATQDGLFSIEQPVDLGLAIGAPAGPQMTGSTLAFSYTVANHADVVAQSLTLTATIPPGTVFQSVNAGSWICSTPSVGASGTVSCTRPTLLGGAQDSVTVSVRAVSTGTFAATATVGGSGTDLSPGNNAANASFSVAAHCDPRPKVAVTTARGGPGQLQATIAAQTLPVTPANSLQRIDITRIDNAAVQLNGSPVAAGATTSFPAGAAQVVLQVQRQTPGVASTVSFTVTDVCGEWRSFVGGGPSAF